MGEHNRVCAGCNRGFARWKFVFFHMLPSSIQHRCGRNAVKDNSEATGGLGTDIARLFADCRMDSEIPELQGHAIEPVSFESEIQVHRCVLSDLATGCQFVTQACEIA
jgi:hypothetical protein